MFFFYSYGACRDLHSFPTRRSSDLRAVSALRPRQRLPSSISQSSSSTVPFQWPCAKDWSRLRSEEHTSELQSHHDLVCRLLLEKKYSSVTKTSCFSCTLTYSPRIDC